MPSRRWCDTETRCWRESALELTPQKREDIAKQLGLLPPDYQGLGRIELAKRIFGAARQYHRLADLWTAVEQIHPEGRPLPNPYAT